jgi:transcriptional regulator with XRE-family HTH domain
MDTFRRLVAEIAGAGIGSGLFADLAASPRPDVQELAATLRKLNEALDASPTPASEWHGVYGALGADELATLLGISPSSVRRYLSGSRATPDEIAARLHFLALVIGDLAGAYNDFGVRRWFQRPRKLLGSRCPAQLLSGTWRPEDPDPQRVRDLAAALVCMPFRHGSRHRRQGMKRPTGYD